MTVRMLTKSELADLRCIYHECNIDPEAAIRKFCEVNGLHIAAPATGQSLNSEAAKPLASSGPDEPTPDSLLKKKMAAVSVELRQRMGRE